MSSPVRGDEHEEVTLADYRALAELRHLIRRFLHWSEEAARAAGLEPQQHQLLLALRGLPEGRLATVGELAERLQVQHHSMVGLVNRLEEHGLIRRRRDSADRRQVLLELTDAGKNLLDELSRFHREELRTLAPDLIDALNRVVGGTENEPGTGAVDPGADV